MEQVDYHELLCIDLGGSPMTARIYVPLDWVFRALAQYTVDGQGRYRVWRWESPNLFQPGSRYGVRVTVEAIPQAERAPG